MNKYFHLIYIITGILLIQGCAKKDPARYVSSVKKQIDSITSKVNWCSDCGTIFPDVAQKIVWKDTLDYKEDTLVLYYSIVCDSGDSFITRDRYKVISLQDSIIDLQLENKKHNPGLWRLYLLVRDSATDREYSKFIEPPWISVNFSNDTILPVIKSDTAVKNISYKNYMIAQPFDECSWRAREIFTNKVYVEFAKHNFYCDTLVYYPNMKRIDIRGPLTVTTTDTNSNWKISGRHARLETETGEFRVYFPK